MTPPVDVAPPVVAAPPVDVAPPLALAPPVAEPPVDIVPPAVVIPPLAVPPDPVIEPVPAEPLLPPEPLDGPPSAPLLQAATVKASAAALNRSQVGNGLGCMTDCSRVALCRLARLRDHRFRFLPSEARFLPARRTVPLPAFGRRCNVFSTWNQFELINF